METNASQSWANGPKLEVQTGHQEKILHLQNSAALEMVIRGSCQISSLRGIRDSAQAKLTWGSLVLWAEGWTGDLQQPLPRDISAFYDMGLVVPAKVFGQTAVCSLVPFPHLKSLSSPPDFTDLQELHCHWALYLFIKLHKKLVNKFKRHWGRQREKRETEGQRCKHTHSLFPERNDHTLLFFVLLPQSYATGRIATGQSMWEFLSFSVCP